jgi:hypothetical protein
MIIKPPNKITAENLLDDLEDSPVVISRRDDTYRSPLALKIDAWMAAKDGQPAAYYYRLNVNGTDRIYGYKSLLKAWEDLLKYYELPSHDCSKDIDYVITRASDDAEDAECRNSISVDDFIDTCGTFADFMRNVHWE